MVNSFYVIYHVFHFIIKVSANKNAIGGFAFWMIASFRRLGGTFNTGFFSVDYHPQDIGPNPLAPPPWYKFCSLGNIKLYILPLKQLIIQNANSSIAPLFADVSNVDAIPKGEWDPGTFSCDTVQIVFDIFGIFKINLLRKRLYPHRAIDYNYYYEIGIMNGTGNLDINNMSLYTDDSQTDYNEYSKYSPDDNYSYYYGDYYGYDYDYTEDKVAETINYVSIEIPFFYVYIL